MFKNYNIDYLYSVVDKSKKSHICELNNDEYIDVLSNDIFSSNSLEKIMPLKNFYSTYNKKNISKKKVVLKNYELSYYNYCKENNVSMLSENEYEIITFFLNKFIRDEDSLKRGYIFKDSNFIASYIQKNYFLDDMDFIKIYYLVEADSFKRCMDDYINIVVKRTINNLLNGDNIETNSDNCFYEDKSYDVHFRESLVENLSLLGIPKGRVEEKIEKFSSLWRDKVMEFTYINRYHPIYRPPFERKISDSVHKDKWISYRKYEYYKKHSDSIVKYGNIEEDMLISDNNAKKLKEYLDRVDKEREEYLSFLGIKEKVKR